jgi:membrane protease YdiL (CAAX protease family)
MTETFAAPAVAPVAAEPQLATYDHALYGTGKPWRGILAIVTFLVGFFILSLVFSAVAVIIDLVTGTTDLETLSAGIISFTPAVMLANNLSLAALIPLSWLLQRLFFGVRGGWLASVTGRFRWRWFGKLALVIVPVWIIYIGVQFMLEPTTDLRLDSSTILMVLIVLFTTPLQSAGEEVGARGFLQRAAGSWFRNPIAAFVAGTVISAALFASAHFAADPWLIAYYVVFAVSASLAARGTGGLEAPILVHAINNLLLLVPVALAGQVDESFDRSAGTGNPWLLIPMALCLAAAAFSTWWGRRSGVVARAPRPEKVRPKPPQYLPPVGPPLYGPPQPAPVYGQPQYAPPVGPPQSGPPTNPPTYAPPPAAPQHPSPAPQQPLPGSTGQFPPPA